MKKNLCETCFTGHNGKKCTTEKCTCELCHYNLRTPLPEPSNYEKRVQEYEAQGITRSDAQGVVDAEEMNKAYHTHAWGSPKQSDTGEKIHWCETCDATKDSDGGIIT